MDADFERPINVTSMSRQNPPAAVSTSRRIRGISTVTMRKRVWTGARFRKSRAPSARTSSRIAIS